MEKFLHLVTIKLHQDQEPLAQFLLGLQGLVRESSVRTQRRTSSLVTQREKEKKEERDQMKGRKLDRQERRKKGREKGVLPFKEGVWGSWMASLRDNI